MKKIILIGSVVVALSGVWLTSCEPSKKNGTTTDQTDTLSNKNSTGNMDTTMHSDTSQRQ